MKYIFIGLFVATLAATPAYIFNYQVMPVLTDLSQQYSGFDQQAQNIASTKEYTNK